MDVDEAVEADELEMDRCRLCLTVSTTSHPFRQGTIPFSRKGKDQFCHAVHMLCYGEIAWSESSQLNFPLHFLGPCD